MSLEPEEEVSEQPTTQEHYGQFHEELQYPQMTHSYNNNFQMSGIDYGTNYNQNIEYDEEEEEDVNEDEGDEFDGFIDEQANEVQGSSNYEDEEDEDEIIDEGDQVEEEEEDDEQYSYGTGAQYQQRGYGITNVPGYDS